MKLNEAEMRMAYQIESTDPNAVLNEIYMTWRLSRNQAARDTAVRHSNSAKLMCSREKESPWNAFISSMACAILGAKPLPFCSFIAIPFHWVVGSFQCTGFKRASVVALSFPTKFGLERPTLEG